MSAVMLERDAVMAAIRDLLRDARGGRGGTLFVVGEAGLGKTTVLRYATAAAGDWFRTGTGQADVAEAALPFGLIGQALDPLLDGQAATTGTAQAPADYFYAVLARLRQAARQPLFLALDDAHWADPDSLTLLRLICRRITELPVAVLVTARPWPPEALRAGEELVASHLAAMQHLAPLSADAARAMLPGAAGDERDQVAALCAGNPLLLGQVAAALRAGEGIPDPRAQASWARRLLLSHLAGLSEPARRYLRAAAVLGRRFQPEVAAQVAGLAAADAAAAQEAFAASGLGRDGAGSRDEAGGRAGAGSRDEVDGWAEADSHDEAGGWAEFGHELIRQAIYELAAPVRARLHETAFRVLAARGDNPGEAAGHAVAAGLAGDPQAVAVTAQAGRQALAAGAVGAARRHLAAAVDLAGPAAPGELVFDLGRALIAAGDHQAGVARYQELLARAELPGDLRLAVLVQLSHAHMAAGLITEAETILDEVVRLAGPGQRDLAAAAMVDHAAQVLVTYGWPRAASLATRARELAAGASTPVRAAAAGVWAVGAYFSGDPAALDVAEAAARSAAATASWRPAGALWWDTVTQYGALALSAERFGDAQRLLDGVIAAAEQRCDPMAAALALLFRSRVSWRLGRLDEALALSTRLTGYIDLVPVLAPMGNAWHAVILADVGRPGEAADWSARADEAVSRGDRVGYSVVTVLSARGLLALRRGDPQAAAAAFAAAWHTADALEHRDAGAVGWAAEAIAAFLACGRDEEARRLVGWVEPAARALPGRWPKVVVAAGRAALAERDGQQDQARACYGEALAIARDMPIPLARSQLLTDYGRFLYRQGEVRAARQTLAEALRLAETCGAVWHAEQARVEWRRAGGRAGVTPPGELTPAEAAVARLAGAGKTNKEIAAQLYLTVNTVETHLRHVYAKLGIHRRAELTSLP
jgi:DNA-binding CsgD family transcriptional regulator